MSELKILKTKRICKDCGKPMPRAISRHYCPLKRRCKKCAKPIPKGNQGFYCSFACYRPKTIFTCQSCAKEFHGKPSENPRFCSRECYERGRQAQMTHLCERCGKQFQRPSCVQGEGRFCSRKCKSKSEEKKVHLQCSHCKTPLTRQPAFAKSKTVYCSKTCHALSKMDQVALICEHCGIEFTRSRYFAEKRRTRFCSMHCRRKFSGETSIEKAVRQALDILSIPYHREHPIQHTKKNNRRGSFYFLDFFLFNLNIAIEADGTYWHKSRQHSDARRDLFLASRGIIVIRLTDKEIEDTVSVSELITQRISALLMKPPR